MATDTLRPSGADGRAVHQGVWHGVGGIVQAMPPVGLVVVWHMPSTFSRGVSTTLTTRGLPYGRFPRGSLFKWILLMRLLLG